MTSKSIVVAVTRGGCIESTHLVDAAVAHADNALFEAYGNTSENIFPRSAIKVLQAIPLVESGAADAFGFEDKHLALACSSHNGEAVHIEAAQEMLQLAGLEDHCLECGAQLPKRPEDQAELIRSGVEIAAIHNNCSGKHAGFVAFAKHVGLPVEGYIKFEHPVQREIASVLEETTKCSHGEENHAIDGCSIPTYTLPLSSLATAFARFGVGESVYKERSRTMIRLRDACMAHPYMVAGKDRVCTQLMEALPGRVFVKVGAEGVYTAALPEKGLGIAMKARDGSFRAVEVAVSYLIAKHLDLNDAEREAIAPLCRPILKNWNGIEVGHLQVVRPN